MFILKGIREYLLSFFTMNENLLVLKFDLLRYPVPTGTELTMNFCLKEMIFAKRPLKCSFSYKKFNHFKLEN